MIAAIVLALAGASPQATAAPRVPSAAAQPVDLGAAMARAGMSPAGIAAVRRVEPAARAATVDLRNRGTAADAEIRAAAQAGDVDRLARALQVRDALLSRYAATRTSTTVALLRSLSPADRRVMIRTIINQ